MVRTCKKGNKLDEKRKGKQFLEIKLKSKVRDQEEGQNSVSVILQTGTGSWETFPEMKDLFIDRNG